MGESFRGQNAELRDHKSGAEVGKNRKDNHSRAAKPCLLTSHERGVSVQFFLHVLNSEFLPLNLLPG